MAIKPDLNQDVEAVKAEVSAAGAARRRMLRRSLGTAAPVVMTLASNPVSAATCVVASSFVSALTLASRKPTSAQPCQGNTPAAWNSKSAFTASGVAPAVTFQTVFGQSNPSWKTGTQFTSSTLLSDALTATSGPNAMLAQYVTAAYLNMKSNKVSATVLNQAQIVQIWTNITQTGTYKPSASSSVQFNAAQTVTWLAAMMG